MERERVCVCVRVCVRESRTQVRRPLRNERWSLEQRRLGLGTLELTLLSARALPPAALRPPAPRPSHPAAEAGGGGEAAAGWEVSVEAAAAAGHDVGAAAAQPAGGGGGGDGAEAAEAVLDRGRTGGVTASGAGDVFWNEPLMLQVGS